MRVVRGIPAVVVALVALVVALVSLVVALGGIETQTYVNQFLNATPAVRIHERRTASGSRGRARPSRCTNRSPEPSL